MHVAVALAYRGAKVAAIDLDPRQRTLLPLFRKPRRNRNAGARSTLPGAEFEVFDGGSPSRNSKHVAGSASANSPAADFLIFDTPGRDDPLRPPCRDQADTLVTPMNDSFVDFDLIGQVDAETFKVRRLCFYAELIWEARKARARSKRRREMDWVVVRNRTGHVEARNMRRIDQALNELSKRVGFRVAQGLSERVIYRELFPSGLTLLDKGHLGELGTSHVVARQELRGARAPTCSYARACSRPAEAAAA